MILNRLLIILLFLPLFFCASAVKKDKIESTRKESDWTIYHPVSSTHFIGVGCAKMEANTDNAQRVARNAALEDISSQIKVRVESNTVVEETQKTIDGQTTDASNFNEKIKTYTESILEGVETVETKVTPEGNYCVKLSLNKAAYFSKLNEKINKARAIAIDGLVASEKADPLSRVYELLSSLKAIEGFTASLMECRINNQDIILHTEILRRLRQALEDIQLKPAIPELALRALDSLPDTIGFHVYCKNMPVENCPVSWSASNADVTLIRLSEKKPGFYPVRISGLSSSVGKITITASIDFFKIRDDLIKLGLRLPGGSMVLSRAKPSVFATGKSEFIESLVNELLNSNTFSMANSAESADYIISASLSVDPNVTVQRSIFQASGKLEFSLNRGKNYPVIEIHRTITAGNGRSEEAAVKTLKKEAVRIALQEINSTF